MLGVVAVAAVAGYTVDSEDCRTTPGYYHFTSASGKFACMISTKEPVLAGRHGPMPTTAPKVPGNGATTFR